MGTIFGYCRVSTKKQSLERQVRNIKAIYPTAIIISEEFTGTKVQNRPAWSRLAGRVTAGDKIIFDEVSRMARNAEEGFAVYQELFKRGVDLVFLKEAQINTETYKQAMEGQIQIDVSTGDVATDDLVGKIVDAINNYLLALAEKQIRIAFEQAAKEAADLSQRTKEGLETARLNGKHLGGVTGRKLHVKKAGPAKDLIRKHCKEFGGSLPDGDVIKLIGISRNTYYKYKREIRENG